MPKDTASGPPSDTAPGRRDLRAVYAVGLFTMGLIDIFVFLIPIYALSLKMTDAQVGWLVGARSVVSLILSIHGGVLMDRFGTRKVTLGFVGCVVAMAPLFPLVPNFYGLLLLQAVTGGAISLAWSGAQTLIAQTAEGDAEFIGRFAFFARIGTTFSPVLAGALWDLGGAWTAYAFGTAWAACAFAAVWHGPEPQIEHADAGPPARSQAPPFRLTHLLPRLADYRASFALAAIPAIAFTGAVILVRNANFGVQTSVYVTYVKGIGFSATLIAILFGAIEAAAGIGSLFAGRTMRRFDPRWFLVVTTATTILLIAATPLFARASALPGVVFTLLLAAQFARGALQGVSQPILFSIQAKAVGRHQQGAVVGLRQTVNRAASILVPPLIGMAADHWGRETAFLVMGGIFLGLSSLLALLARRVPPGGA